MREIRAGILIRKHSQISRIRNQSKTMKTTAAKLQIQNISKRFITSQGDIQALQDIDLTISPGEFVCLVGPSGCGKSTLLQLIAGLDEPDSGQILEDGNPIGKPGPDRLMMFQEHALFPWLNTLDNVLFGLKLQPKLSKAQRRETAEHYLDMVGLQRFKRSYIHELSGGMKQRVALARSLAPNPKVLLMDEPFGALDAMTRELLYADLQQICLEQEKTVLFVTHNVREAVCLGDRVFLLSPQPGHIREEFKIQLNRPRNINSVDLAEYATTIVRTLKTATQ